MPIVKLQSQYFIFQHTQHTILAVLKNMSIVLLSLKISTLKPTIRTDGHQFEHFYIKPAQCRKKAYLCHYFPFHFFPLFITKNISHPASKHYRSPAGTASRCSTQKNIQITQKTGKNSFFIWHVYSGITELDSGYILTCIYLTVFRVAATVHEQTEIKYRMYC